MDELNKSTCQPGYKILTRPDKIDKLTLRFKSVNGGSVNGNLPHMNSATSAALPRPQLQPPPPPPLLKKVKTEALLRPPPAILFPTAAAPPMMEGLEDAMLPMPSNCIKTAPDSYACALCNATYGNMVSFRQHTKFHEDERDREQRNLMLNNMVSMCYSKCRKLQCISNGGLAKVSNRQIAIVI